MLYLFDLWYRRRHFFKTKARLNCNRGGAENVQNVVSSQQRSFGGNAIARGVDDRKAQTCGTEHDVFRCQEKTGLRLIEPVAQHLDVSRLVGQPAATVHVVVEDSHARCGQRLNRLIVHGLDVYHRLQSFQMLRSNRGDYADLRMDQVRRFLDVSAFVAAQLDNENFMLRLQLAVYYA